MYSSDDVIKKYDRAIHKYAQKYYTDNPRFSYEDLVAQGQVAAINATQSYDENCGASFITFLFHAIDNEVRKFVTQNKFDTSVKEYGQRKAFKEDGNTDSLKNNNAISDEGFYSTIASGALSPEQSMIIEEQLSIMMEELYTLPAHERNVVEKRWLEGQTLQQVADVLKVSKQTISSWEKKGFSSLQKKVQSRLGKEM